MSLAKKLLPVMKIELPRKLIKENNSPAEIPQLNNIISKKYSHGNNEIYIFFIDIDTFPSLWEKSSIQKISTHGRKDFLIDIINQ